MTKYIILFFTVLVFSSYQTSENNVNNEVIDFDSILINNNIKFLSTTETIIQHLSQPDSIISQFNECGKYFEGVVMVYYYGQTSFETQNDLSVLHTLNFESGHFTLKTSKMVLGKNTTLSDFKNVYPIASSDSYDWTDELTNKTYRLIRLPTKANYDDQWVLKFYNDKLSEMQYWIPC